ncbi:hypothetical protein BDV93DRAFT_564878 [Ceratobasidium sp. AG-I]|nr:hypothetical protein BDV93DRAFT_564878 [Ceratobasidium sp. AG-I]
MSNREVSPPLPPPAFLMSHVANYIAPTPSSTQRAVVNGPESQHLFNTATLSSQAARPVHPMLAALATKHGLAVTLVPEPCHIRPLPKSQIPNPHPCNPAPNASRCREPPSKLPPNPDTATESETKSERPGPSASTRSVLNSRPTQLNTRHNPDQVDNRKKSNPIPPTRGNQHARKDHCTHDDNDQLSEHSHPDDLGRGVAKAMAGGSEEAVIEWAVHLMRQPFRRPASNLSHSRAQPTAGPSHSGDQPKSQSKLQSRFHASAKARTPGEICKHAQYRRVEDVPTTPPPGSSHDDLPEPEELLTAMAAAAAGVHPPVNHDKNGLGKYPGVRKLVASKAILDLIAKVAQKGVYQDHDTLLKWSVNAYCHAWKKYAAVMTHPVFSWLVLSFSWLMT